MDKPRYNNDDLEKIAKEIIEMLRPKHLSVSEIKIILRIAESLLGNVVLREW